MRIQPMKIIITMTNDTQSGTDEVWGLRVSKNFAVYPYAKDMCPRDRNRPWIITHLASGGIAVSDTNFLTVHQAIDVAKRMELIKGIDWNEPEPTLHLNDTIRGKLSRIIRKIIAEIKHENESGKRFPFEPENIIPEIGIGL